MDITFMYTDSPNNALQKNYSNVAAFDSVYARNNVSIVHPDITLETTPGTTDGANYAYINDFGRFYFIVDREVLTNGLMRFRLKEDVLMSFHVDILTGNGIVERQRDNYDMYLPDNQIPVDCRKAVTYRKIGDQTPFHDASIIMTVLGGS